MIPAIIDKRRNSWHRGTPEAAPQTPAKRRTWARTRSHRQRGALAVEVAVVAPIVFFITLGIIDVGRCLMVVHLLNDAAQLGCRAVIIEGQTTARITKVVV